MSVQSDDNLSGCAVIGEGSCGIVIPAQAGIHSSAAEMSMDSRLRGNDGIKAVGFVCRSKRAHCFIALTVLSVGVARAVPPDLSGIWMPETKRTEALPRVLPYTPQVQAAVDLARKTYDEHLDDAGRNCLPYGMPQSMLGTAAYPHEIIQKPDRITMLYELHMGVRRIYLDGRKIPADAMRTRMGYSIGHWEGSTLVVETAALSPQNSGSRRSEQMRIVERFDLLTGPTEKKGKALRVQITIDDPATYTRPMTVNKYYTYGTGEFQMGEYFCTEDLWQQIYSGNESRIPWR